MTMTTTEGFTFIPRNTTARRRRTHQPAKAPVGWWVLPIAILSIGVWATLLTALVRALI